MVVIKSGLAITAGSKPTCRAKRGSEQPTSLARSNGDNECQADNKGDGMVRVVNDHKLYKIGTGQKQRHIKYRHVLLSR